MGKHVDMIDSIANYELTAVFMMKSAVNNGRAGIRWNIANEDMAASNGAHMSIELDPRTNRATFTSKSKTAKFSKTTGYRMYYNRWYTVRIRNV